MDSMFKPGHRRVGTGRQRHDNVRDVPQPSAFDQDIGGGGTPPQRHEVMGQMFYYASAFDQDIGGGWDTCRSCFGGSRRLLAVTSGVDDAVWMFLGRRLGIPSTRTSAIGTPPASQGLNYMFYYASAFDQDLGWCVDDGVGHENGFFPSARASRRRAASRKWTTSAATPPSPTTP